MASLTQPKKLIIVGIAAGIFFLAVSRVVVGSGFLMTIFALICFFAAFCSGLYLPYKGHRARKLVKTLRVLTALCLILGIASFAVVQGLIISGWADNEAVDADCLIILGAGLRGEQLSYALYSRLRVAADYMLDNPGCVAIVSGGQGPDEDITEALAMKRFLTGQGIADQRIFMEDKSSSTIENLKYSMEIMEDNGLMGRKVAVVSNHFHLFRTKWLANYYGLSVQTLGAGLKERPASLLNSYVREYFSIVLIVYKNLTGKL